MKETDGIVWGVFQALQADLGSHTNLKPCETLDEARNLSYEIPRYSSPYRVKASRQLCDWLKRYRFRSELTIDLNDATNTKFDGVMLRIAEPYKLSYRSSVVIQKARKIIRDLLGDPPSDVELLQLGRFSRNSVVGCSFNEVYLDRKLYHGASVSGTAEELQWFFQLCKGDPLLNTLELKPQEVKALHQSNVPKSWKINRPVRPNTLIGSIRSLGFGQFIVNQLKIKGIDLRHLQTKHQRLAKSSSRSLRLATADLSAASDAFTPEFVNRILPRKWYTALKFGRTPYYTREDSNGKRTEFYGPSFMAMGIGYTFAVMTVIFWALLTALSELSGIKGTISVFGDDLIYPSKLHGYVKTLFQDLRFVLNSDKTFVIPPFRESCGGDFYDSIEVRPASPEGVSEVLEGDIAISAYVYKLFNSLIRRWSEVELPTTFAFLRLLAPLAFSVPDHFPDSSGFKDGNWRSNLACESSETWSTGVLNQSKVENKRIPLIQQPLVRCLCSRAEFRPVCSQEIYYWEYLAGTDVTPDLYDESIVIESGMWLVRSSHDVLTWRRVKVREGKKWIRKLEPFSCKRDKVKFTIGYIYI